MNFDADPFLIKESRDRKMMKLESNTSLGVFFVAIKPPQNRQAELAQWADADVGCSASKSTSTTRK